MELHAAAANDAGISNLWQIWIILLVQMY